MNPLVFRFIIRWKKRIEPAMESMPFACYNFMPTLLGLLGIEVPDQVEGTDYSDLIRGGKQEKASSAVIASYGNPARLMAVGQKPSVWALMADSLHRSGIDWKTSGYRGLRTERYTYVVDRGGKKDNMKRYLYDNQEDPYQLNPVIAGMLKKMRLWRNLTVNLQHG